MSNDSDDVDKNDNNGNAYNGNDNYIVNNTHSNDNIRINSINGDKNNIENKSNNIITIIAPVCWHRSVLFLHVTNYTFPSTFSSSL